MAAALAVAWGRAGRSVSRRVVPLPPPRPRGAPPFPSSCSPAARTQAEILAGAGAQPPASFGRWPKSVARGARALPSPLSLRSASRPLAVRAPLAAPCAPSRAYARRVPPSSGGQATAVKGVASLQREHRGTGTRLRRSDRRLTAAIKPESTKKAPALTKSGGIGRFPTPKRPAERPKMGYGVPRSVRYGSIVPSLTA